MGKHPGGVVVLLVAALAGGCDRQAERDRIAEDGRRRQAEHEQRMADMREEHRKKMAAMEAETERMKRATVESKVQARLFVVATAYAAADAKLGRPPRSADELKPHLADEAALRSPRDGEPFEVAWGAPAAPGRALAWEKATGADGKRWVFVPADPSRPALVTDQVRRVTDPEFDALRRRPPAPVVLPTTPAPAPPITVVPPPAPPPP